MRLPGLALGLTLAVVAAACGNGQDGAEAPDGEGPVTIYSGRSEELVGPIIEQFEESSGADVEVRYGDTAELAAQILEEGGNSPADVFFAQDAGALGALASAGRFASLPDETLEQVPGAYRSPDGLWVGTSGRARVLVYNVEAVEESALPDSVLDLTGDAWSGRVGWAPTNGSFQAFITALRLVEGEDEARAWLEGMEAGGAQDYEGNSQIVLAVAAGEIDAGLVNHYYLLELGSEDASIKENAANHFFGDGDVGSIVNAAGVGIIEGSDAPQGAQAFVDFMLSRTGEQYFDEEVYEYPLSGDLSQDPSLPDLDEIQQPDIDLSDLSDLEGTLALLRDTGVL
jgi:iron(III) transport system substrate-binding protein